MVVIHWLLKEKWFAPALLFGLFIPQAVFGTFDAASHDGHTTGYLMSTMAMFGLLLILAKLGTFVERFGQPAVLGELLIGVLIGNATLVGINLFADVPSNIILLFGAEVGLVLLLFHVGLESDIYKMKAVGVQAFFVAIVGVALPFILGAWVLGPLLFPDLPFIAHLFIGSALTATSVGITARVFQDMGISNTKDAQIVLNAAVLDDVIGLIILAVVVGMATTGTVSVGSISLITGKALAFLFLSIALGIKFAGFIGSIFSRISSGHGRKLTIVLAFAFGFSYLASKVGLAGIVGAYAAGLVLDPVHFTKFRRPKFSDKLAELSGKLEDGDTKNSLDHLVRDSTERQIEDLIHNACAVLTPIFFIFTGMQVQLATLADPSIWGVGAIVIIVAVLGKVVSGAVAGKGVNKLLVGFGMVPRGEVGLIFATMGLSLEILNQETFAVIVLMVIVTTLITPPILGHLVKRQY